MSIPSTPTQEPLDPYLGKEKKTSFLARHPNFRSYCFYGSAVVAAAAIMAASYVGFIALGDKEPNYERISGVPIHAEVQPLGDSYNSELGLQLIVDGEKSVCTGWGKTKDVTKAKVLLEDRIDSASNVDMSIFYREGDCRIKQLNFPGEQISLYWQTGD